jgi:hypothetical protein
VLPLTATYGGGPEDAVAVAVVLALSETGPGVLLGALCAVREGACANWPRRERPIGTPATAPPEALAPAGVAGEPAHGSP